MCRTFLDPEGGGIEKRLLLVVKSQPGRLVYRCRTVIHVKSRLDLEAGRYGVKLTTLYDSNQRKSYIRNEVRAGATEDCGHIISCPSKDD
jgi:hypothetical protein